MHSDGAVCNRAMSGTVTIHSSTGKQEASYRCPPRALGGCSGSIATTKLDPLIEELLFAHIAANSPDGDGGLSVTPDPDDPDVGALSEVQS
jgi:hypothetical protein